MNASAVQPDLRLAWQVRSITVVRGQWEICTRPNYVGDCAWVSANMFNIAPLGIGYAIQGMRPVTTTPPPRPVPVAGFGPSLRGMNAEFFSQPSQDGRRILACQTGSATANCARATAEQFCRARGYNFVGNVSLETAGRRVVLADVLCKRTNA
ncbi:MAG: hypothetical protein Q8R02_19285 [Hyphomonadaceae bacterium]|nr:hypothetical protein [Hyphomonadaceae bacterium]